MIDLLDDVGATQQSILAINDFFESCSQLLTTTRINADDFTVRRSKLVSPEYGTSPGLAFKLLDFLRDVFKLLHFEEQQLGVVPLERTGRFGGHRDMGLADIPIVPRGLDNTQATC